MMSCDDNIAPPTEGCLAFVRNTRFIYIQSPGEDCMWLPWVCVCVCVCVCVWEGTVCACGRGWVGVWMSGEALSLVFTTVHGQLRIGF